VSLHDQNWENRRWSTAKKLRLELSRPSAGCRVPERLSQVAALAMTPPRAPNLQHRGSGRRVEGSPLIASAVREVARLTGCVHARAHARGYASGCDEEG
jgi:hypothetical protein